MRIEAQNVYAAVNACYSPSRDLNKVNIGSVNKLDPASKNSPKKDILTISDEARAMAASTSGQAASTQTQAEYVTPVYNDRDVGNDVQRQTKSGQIVQQPEEQSSSVQERAVNAYSAQTNVKMTYSQLDIFA